MKDETKVRNCLNTIRNFVRDYFERQQVINLDYASVYRKCFDGSNEEVERKLAIWDDVHRITREHYAKGGY